MKNGIGFVVAVVFAVATIGVAEDAFARGGGGAPAPAPAPAAPAPAPAAAPNIGNPVSSSSAVDYQLAFPRLTTDIRGCTTTNFGSEGGIVPCPER